MKKYFFGIAAVAFCILSFMTADAQGGVLEKNRFIYPEYSKAISMDFENADLNDVLKIFSQQSGLNFIAADEVIDKKITLFLDKVPSEEALERILRANNLTYEIQSGSNVFIVKALERPDRELITRVYKLRHATVTSSKLYSTFTISKGEETEGASVQADPDTTGIVAALNAVLSKSGKLTEDPRTNSITVTDVPTQFPMIEQTIARLDVPIPQILIEVEMLDISESTADLLGIKAGATPLTFTGGERDHVYPWNQNRLLDKGFTFEDAEYRVGTISAAGLSAMLQLLRTKTDTKNLARPRILTLNNETAQIKISTDEAIGIKSITQASEGSSVLSVEAERVETGVFLTVTPQANLYTREITMAIAPTVIEATVGGTFSGNTFRNPEERGSKSVLRVKNSETIILGGLLRNNSSDTKTKVPFISEIPIIGAAFRHKDKSDTNRELVIFITPHIVPDEGLSKLALGGSRPLIREQEIPAKRVREIERALRIFENR